MAPAPSRESSGPARAGQGQRAGAAHFKVDIASLHGAANMTGARDLEPKRLLGVEALERAPGCAAGLETGQLGECDLSLQRSLELIVLARLQADTQSCPLLADLNMRHHVVIAGGADLDSI